MKKNIVICALVALLVLPVGTASAQTTSQISLAETLQALMQQVEVLQKRLAELRGEVREVQEEIRSTLRIGMENEDVEKLQELLASDPEIYPEGLRTGYFGNLTRGALLRFQARHEIEQTGEVDDATRELLNEYFAERNGGTVPPGLLRAPGIQDKIERRIANGCDDTGGMAFLCERLKNKHSIDSDEKKERAEKREKRKDRKQDQDDDDTELEIEVEIEDNIARVNIQFTDGSEVEYQIDGEEVDLTDEDAIIAAIAEEKDLSEADVAAVIEIEYSDDDDEENDDEQKL